MTPPEVHSPAADALLAALRERASRSGRLHIFLGMCSGVGKTYDMLQAALQRQAEGAGVLVGLVETHDRPETVNLLKGLPALPPSKIVYRGIRWEKLDLDGALERRPDLLVVDAMARANAPGSRHLKCYQDVLELLDAGIDVFTTLNVQEIESQANVLRQVAGLPVAETVPDSILDRAHEIQLVDISVEKLLERLSEGKVNLGEKADWAALNFFTPGNLTALREMALRFTAERVDRDLEEICSARRVANPLRSGAPLLVGVGPGPHSERLIHWTHDAAVRLACPWVVVWVDGARALAAHEQERLARTLRLARRLGGEVVLTSGPSVSEALLCEARSRRASQIIVGKSAKPPHWRHSVVDQVLLESSDIDVCVVRPITQDNAKRPASVAPEYLPPAAEMPHLGQYLIAMLLPFAIAAACWRVVEMTGYMFVGMVFLFAVVFGALRLGRGPLLLMTTLSALVWDFFFIPPRFAIRVEKLDDIVIIAMFFIVAFNMFTSLLRNRDMVERRQQRQTAALLNVTQSVAFSVEPQRGLADALQSINALFRAETALVVCHEDHSLSDVTHEAGTFQPVPAEWSAIRWSFENQEPAGRFTGSFSNSDATWFPLQTATAVMGVLGVWLPVGDTMDFSARQMLEALSLQLALALEKEQFIRALQQTEVLEASEQLRRTLLDSVSHELKTPLAALQAATDELDHDPGQAARYLPELRAAQHRLRRTVDNLLNMSRLESGAAKPVLDWCDVDQVCDAALELVGDALCGHRLNVDVPVELPMVRLDQALIEQALANLLLNAATHTPPGSEVTLCARMSGQRLILSVLDRGPGLPPGDSGRLFQKFARGESAPAGGSGLGLAIARGFARAHGGTATASARDGGGTDFSLALPVETLQRDVHETIPVERAHH